MTPRKILCPIDFSAGSHHAFRVAARLATELDATLELVHAWHLPAYAIGVEYPLPADAIQGMVDDAERGLTDSLAEARKLGVARVSSQLVSGPPWERIVELARRDDLIVMGTHGRTGVTRFLLGSVAEKVVRHAPCSVLVARPHGEPAPFQHLLVPLDFSESSRLALDRAGDLASRTGARVTLLHVIEVPAIYRGQPPASFVHDIDTRASAQLDEWANLVEQKTRTRVDRLVRTGAAAAQSLALVAEDPTIDLVVVGSHGRTGMKRILLGSVAEKLVRHAGLPVLVVR
jgi:nucleotide-binding universal stress UspA family protein